MNINQALAREYRFHPDRSGGALKDKIDPRDYSAEELMGVAPSDVPTFAQGYDVVERLWSDMPNKNQYRTFSCVGQAWAHYKQILQFLDNGDKVELSAKSIYNPIAFPGKGSYIRAGGMRTIDYGVNLESDIPGDKDESAMTKKFDFTLFGEKALYYRNATIAMLNTQDFDVIARMIYQNNGVVAGWDGHCMFFKGYGIMQGKRYLKTHNSYGPGSDLYYIEGVNNHTPLYSAWTAVDERNMPNVPGKYVRLVRAVGHTNVYSVINGKRYLVWSPTMMQDGVGEGLWEGFKAVEDIPELDLRRIPLVKMPFSDFLKNQLDK